MPTSTRKCRYCKERKRAESMIITPNNAAFCDRTCAAKYGKEKTPQVRKKQIAEQRRENKEAKARLKPNSHWLKATQAVFNRWVVLRDKNEPCISCGAWDVEEFHAGHYRSIGAAGHLRYDPDNVHKQCSQCNTHLSGNQERYRVNLLNKIGEDRVKALEESNRPRSWDYDELKVIRKEYSALCRELEKQVA